MFTNTWWSTDESWNSMETHTSQDEVVWFRNVCGSTHKHSFIIDFVWSHWWKKTIEYQCQWITEIARDSWFTHESSQEFCSTHTGDFYRWLSRLSSSLLGIPKQSDYFSMNDKIRRFQRKYISFTRTLAINRQDGCPYFRHLSERMTYVLCLRST